MRPTLCRHHGTSSAGSGKSERTCSKATRPSLKAAYTQVKLRHYGLRDGDLRSKSQVCSALPYHEVRQRTQSARLRRQDGPAKAANDFCYVMGDLNANVLDVFLEVELADASAAHKTQFLMDLLARPVFSDCRETIVTEVCS